MGIDLEPVIPDDFSGCYVNTIIPSKSHKLTLRKEDFKNFEFFRLNTGVVCDCANCRIVVAPC